MSRSSAVDYDRIARTAWCDVLGRSVIAPDDDFFLLGGDSFAAVHLVSNLAEPLGLQGEDQFMAIFVALFDHPRFADFASNLAEQTWGAATAPSRA